MVETRSRVGWVVILVGIAVAPQVLAAETAPVPARPAGSVDSGVGSLTDMVDPANGGVAGTGLGKMPPAGKAPGTGMSVQGPGGQGVETGLPK